MPERGWAQAELAAGEAHVFELRRVLEAERADVSAAASALAGATAQAQARSLRAPPWPGPLVSVPL